MNIPDLFVNLVYKWIAINQLNIKFKVSCSIDRLTPPTFVFMPRSRICVGPKCGKHFMQPITYDGNHTNLNHLTKSSKIYLPRDTKGITIMQKANRTLPASSMLRLDKNSVTFKERHNKSNVRTFATNPYAVVSLARLNLTGVLLSSNYSRRQPNEFPAKTVFLILLL